MTKSQPNSVVLDGNGGFEYKKQPYTKGIMYQNGDFDEFKKEVREGVRLRDEIDRLLLIAFNEYGDSLDLQSFYSDLIDANIFAEDFGLDRLINWINNTSDHFYVDKNDLKIMKKDLRNKIGIES